MIDIIVSYICALLLFVIYFVLTRKISNQAHILIISLSLLVIILIFNFLVNNPIINFIFTFTICIILLLFILEVVRSSNTLFNGESIFQEEEIKE